MARSKQSDGPDSDPPKRRKSPRKRRLSKSLGRSRRRASARLRSGSGESTGSAGKRSGRSSERGRGAAEQERRPPRKAGSLLSRAAAGFVALLATVVAIGAGTLGRIAKLIGATLGSLRGPARAVGTRLAALVSAAARVLTPTRCLLAAAIGCAILLALSQFADYRGVAIGGADYVGVEGIAPPPEVDRAETGSAHSYLMVPAAVIAIVVLLIAVRSRRWRLCRLAMLIGLAAVAVSIFIDRPEGLDEGVVARDFSGAEASLLGGFWAQLFAGVGLVATSALLAAELRRRGPRRNRRRERVARGGERTSGRRPKPKGAPGTEGASA